MKKYFLNLFLILIVLTSKAQLPDYVVTNSGDTITGEISINNKIVTILSKSQQIIHPAKEMSHETGPVI